MSSQPTPDQLWRKYLQDKGIFPPPPVCDPLGCGPFTAQQKVTDGEVEGFSIHPELLLLPTFAPGLKVGHGAQQFLLAATKEKFEGITTVNKYRAHPVADFFLTFLYNIL